MSTEYNQLTDREGMNAPLKRLRMFYCAVWSRLTHKLEQLQVSMDGGLSGENWRNYQKFLFQCHFIHHSSHMMSPCTEHKVLCRVESINCLIYGTVHSKTVIGLLKDLCLYNQTVFSKSTACICMFVVALPFHWHTLHTYLQLARNTFACHVTHSTQHTQLRTGHVILNLSYKHFNTCPQCIRTH